MTITLELTPDEEQRLQQLAAEQGKSAAEIALQAIKRVLPRPQPTRDEIVDANAELFSHTSDLGYATGADNAQMDNDRVRGYTQEELEAADRAVLECAVDAPYAVGADNESINADLTREYTRAEIEASDDELFSHIVYAPEAVGADNDSIDADLIAAYENKPIPSVRRRRNHAG